MDFMNITIIAHPATIRRLIRTMNPSEIKTVNFIQDLKMTEPRRTHKRKRVYKKWAHKYRKPSSTYHVTYVRY